MGVSRVVLGATVRSGGVEMPCWGGMGEEREGEDVGERDWEKVVGNGGVGRRGEREKVESRKLAELGRRLKGRKWRRKRKREVDGGCCRTIRGSS